MSFFKGLVSEMVCQWTGHTSFGVPGTGLPGSRLRRDVSNEDGCPLYTDLLRTQGKQEVT